MKNKVAYDNKFICVRCGGKNKVTIVDTLQDGSIISECKTKCKKCGHDDYWGYGFFESRSDINNIYLHG